MEILRDIRFFAEAGMQLDNDERLLKPNEYRECYESIVNVSADSNIGCLENIKGTTNIFDLAINSTFTLPSGTFMCIGAKEDTEDNAIIYMLCDTVGTNHCIMRMFIDNYRCEWIFRAESVLNFQADHKITSIWRIGDLLGWTDNYEGTPFVDYNPPRKVNIVKATAYTNPYSATKTYYPNEVVGYGGKSYRYIYSFPGYGALPTNTAVWEVANVGIYAPTTDAELTQILDRIKYPPIYAPTATFDSDNSYKDSCKLRGRMFQFAYRYVYDDNEKSVKSPPSDIPLAHNQFVDGSYIDDNLSNNVIKITVNTSITEVVAIELLVRIDNYGLWSKFDRIEKYDTDGDRLINDSISYVYNFYNNTVLEAISEDDAKTLYHAVPQISAHEKLIEKNRIIDGNYVEGFDKVDVDLTLTPFAYGGGTLNSVTSHAYDYPTYYILSYIGDDGLEYSHEFRCITIDATLINNFTDNGFWGISIQEANNISNLVQASYIVRKGDYYTNMLNSFCDQISDEQYLNFPVFCRTKIPSPWDTQYNTHGNSVGLGKIPYGKIAFAIARTDLPGFIGVSTIYAKLFASGGISGSCGFKSHSWYEAAVTYFDRGARFGSPNSNSTTRIYIPSQKTLSGSVLSGTILKVDVNHRPPMEADSYEIMITKRLSMSYFNYFRINTIEKTTYSTNVYGVDLNTLTIQVNSDINDMHEFFPQTLVAPYSHERGDRLRFVYYDDESTGFYTNSYFPDELDFEIISANYPTGATYGDTGYKKDTASSSDFILDVDGNKIRNDYSLKITIPNFNTAAYSILNDFTNINVDANGRVKNRVYIEIYRPTKETQTKIFYGCSGRLPILNPHTSTRYHSGGTSHSTISWNRNQTAIQSARLFLDNGDVWNTIRFTGKLGLTVPFPIEYESFSDFYQSDSYNQGIENITIRDYRRTRYISNLLYGGMYIENTLTNDLSKVGSSDNIALAEKYGEINLIEEVGYTLKVLQKYKPTSLYIGREGLKQASLMGQDVVTTKDAVLSTPIVSESDYGTTLTSGCTKYLRNIYFPDLYNGAILRDAPNGIFPISDYGIKNYIRQKFQTFISHGIDNIVAYSTYDEKYNLVFFSFVDAAYPTENFTVAFHEPTNKWISFYSFTPDYFGCLGQCLTSFKGNGLWLHDSGTRMNYYGVQYEQMVKIVANKDPLKVHAFKSIVIDSNKAWNAGTNGDILITANGSMTRGASSKLPEGWFELREGKYYSNFGRNMLSSSSTESNEDLINGDELRGSSMSINLRNASTDETKLFAAIIDSTYSPKSGGQ